MSALPLPHQKIVWVNGVFDILHIGHIHLFQYAKNHGDFLIVGIDSDERVKQLKGPSRPINKQEDRKLFLESIIYIDRVVIFNSEEELENTIRFFEPNIMIVGDDYKNKKVIGSQYAKQLLFFEKIVGYSSTNIIQKLETDNG